MHTDLGMSFFLGSIHRVLSEIHLGLGNLAKALAHGEEAVGLSRKNNERHQEGLAMITLGRVIAARDPEKFEEGREEMLRGITLLDELWIRPNYAMGLLQLGELYMDAGQREGAVETLKKAEALFQEMGMDHPLARTREVLARLLA